jgi:hypothetical protein
LPDQFQLRPKSLLTQVSPPLRIKPNPPLGLTEAQLPLQLGMPGKCAQGAPSDVPLLLSEPDDFEI